MSILERVYFFHDELIRDTYPNARTLMGAFEISRITARRDIAYLRDRLLAPLAFNPQKNGFYYSEEDFNLPFENSPRIIFLLGMLNRLAEETGLSNLQEIIQLEKKLSKLVSQESTHLIGTIHCEWIEVEHPDPAIFDAIIEAIVKKRQLNITYRSLKQKHTDRIVEPVKLVNYQGRWYLWAWCTLRHDHRLFHLARVLNSTVGKKCQLSPESLSSDLERSFGIFKGAPRYFAEILFTDTAAELVKNQFWHKDQVVEEVKEGILFRVPVRDDREIMMKIMQYGAQARVLNPQELVEKISKETNKMRLLYDAMPLVTHEPLHSINR